MIKKLPMWEGELIKHVTLAIGTSFEWGKSDCTSFALDCLKAMCGDFEHPALDYKDEAGALEFVKQSKLSLYDFMRLNMDVTPVMPNHQSRGDIVFVRRKGFDCLHVVIGRNFASCWPDKGVYIAPTKDLPRDHRILGVN